MHTIGGGRGFIFVAILALACAARPASLFAAAPFPAQLPGTAINQNLPSDVEPSGIVWHPRLNQLFVISDNGWLHKMNLDGTGVMSWFLGGDLEAVTIADPATNFVYIANENVYWIHEFNFVTGQVTRTFDLSPWITAPANLGIEGLAFVNKAGHPEGGEFYVGMQGDCRILRFSLPVKTSWTSLTATYIATIAPVAGMSIIGDLNYDVTSDTLYVLYNGSNVIRAMRPDGAYIADWQAPLNYQEGIAVNPSNCEIYIADDSGPVYRYSGFSTGDQDGDGVPNCADACPGTGAGQAVDAQGCSCYQIDADHDGVADCSDLCQGTPAGEPADSNGCSCSQRDSDGDGINDCQDTNAGQAGSTEPDADKPNGGGQDEPGQPNSGEPQSIGGGVSGTTDVETAAGEKAPVGACGVGAASMAPISLLGMMSMRRCGRRGRRN